MLDHASANGIELMEGFIPWLRSYARRSTVAKTWTVRTT